MHKSGKLLVFLIVLFLNATALQAQYVNVDSLVHIPGEEYPVYINELNKFLEEQPAEDFLVGQELFDDQHIPAGNLLKHFTLPSGGRVISRYGWRSGRMHTGTDLKMDKGDTIYAVFQGTVTRSKWFSGYGNMVVIDHGMNIETSYAHLSAYLVQAGEVVRRGQPIGLAGSTGRATTNHLHFEIREAGKHFNPELVYDFEAGKVKEQVLAIQSITELLPGNQKTVSSVVGATPQNYIVSEGDSLWKISHRFKTSVKTLCLINNLDENSVLNVGMVLKLF